MNYISFTLFSITIIFCYNYAGWQLCVIFILYEIHRLFRGAIIIRSLLTTIGSLFFQRDFRIFSKMNDLEKLLKNDTNESEDSGGGEAANEELPQ